MTNLTSEQYRDVLKHIPDCTTEIPNIQQLLRRAIQTFFKRFGAYPELAGVAPGKVGIFGEQTQFSGGLAMPVATPMATIVVGRRAKGSRFAVATSADVGKPHKVIFSFSRNRPLGPGCPTWLNYVKGAIDNYPDTVPPFEAAIESSVPIGVGLGSSAAIEVATYSFLEVLVGKKSDPIEKAKALQKAEADFAGKEVGLVDRITSIMAKDRNAMLIDCKTNEVTWIPFRNRSVTMVAVNSHLKDELFGDEYPKMTKYLKKACEILGVENLRSCTEEHLEDLQNGVNEILVEEEELKKLKEEEGEEEEEGAEEQKSEGSTDTEVWTKEDYDEMIKIARFFITEMNRVNEAIEAWRGNDVSLFGQKMIESHKSLKEDMSINNPLLDFLVESSLEVEGVLGSKMTGMGLGFGGGIVTLLNKNKVEEYCKYMTEKYANYESELAEEIKGTKQSGRQRQKEVVKKFHTKHYNPNIASSEKIGMVQDILAAGILLQKMLAPRTSTDNPCLERRKSPCIVKVEKPPGGCGTWGQFQKERAKEKFLRKVAEEEGEEGEGEEKKENGEKKEKNWKGEKEGEWEEVQSQSSEVSDIPMQKPSFYIISPFAGARMMFVTKADMLRSLYAKRLPHPKTLVREAMKEFEATYSNKVEAIGLAPAVVYLFGEFMEYQLGYIITMTLPMYVVTVGGRSDNVFFSFKTTSKEVEEPTDMRKPIPSVREIEFEPRHWVNLVSAVVTEFKGHVPGFNAVVHSNVPIQAGMHSCAALQSSIYTYLEDLTKTCTTDPFEKINRCTKSEIEFEPSATELVNRCAHTKFFPVFLSKEGHLMFINCKSNKITNYFFDDPSYVFLIASCKHNTNNVTPQTLEQRLHHCLEALNILNRKSLLFLDLKHLRCLKKRDATDEIIKTAKYVITEHQRTVDAVKAIKNQDYARVGLLMSQSHASLRDDFDVSSPEIEELISLAMKVDGVLGAKMIGSGFNASIIILIKISEVDKCIRYMRKNYKNKSDKPTFYVTKPAGAAYPMHPTVELPYILENPPHPQCTSERCSK